LAALAVRRSQAKLILTRHVLFPLNRIHKLTLRRTSRVIAVSQAVADALNSQWIFESRKITVIHNGIDFGRFEPAAKATAQTEEDHFRVGMIGHLAAIKGPHDFIRAAAIVCAQRSDVEFVIAGEDKSRNGENRADLEKLISDLALNDRIRLLGWIDNVAELLSTFDVFISPSRAEPFGLSIVEAMAAGIPVIATASEGAREIIEDGATGRLVPIDDSNALAQAIQDFLDNANEPGRLAANAKTSARERFSVGTMVDRTERVYAEVLTGV
jgi:glycosyltransferase involved in cell wall biosynthesis